MQTTSQPNNYVDSHYLDSVDAFMRPVKRRSHELMRLAQGQTVLDLGCGVGIDTLLLAELLGTGSHVVGMDRDQTMIDEANRRARASGMDACIRHQLGDAAAIPYPDQFFDACRSERLLMHVDDGGIIITELHRVLKNGGWLVIVEPDWATLSIAAESMDIERRIVRVLADRYLKNGYAGRKLYQWMRKAGFEEVAIENHSFWFTELPLLRYLTNLDEVESIAVSESVISSEELDNWRLELEKDNDEGCFYASITMNMVSGKKGQ